MQLSSGKAGSSKRTSVNFSLGGSSKSQASGKRKVNNNKVFDMPQSQYDFCAHQDRKNQQK
jgi:hypothetical protein